MLIDLIGPNCIGKSTLIDALLRRTGGSFLDLADTRYAAIPRASVRRVVVNAMSAPSAPRSVAAYLIVRGRLSLAHRVLHYSKWQQETATATDLAYVDENVLKKIFEAVPYGTDVDDFWARFARDAGAGLLATANIGERALAFLCLDEGEYLRRFRQRHFADDHTDERVLTRFRTQLRCQDILYGKSRLGGPLAIRVDVGELESSVEAIAGIAERATSRSSNRLEPRAIHG